MEERRRSTREPTYLHGVIYFNNGRDSMSCVIRDQNHKKETPTEIGASRYCWQLALNTDPPVTKRCEEWSGQQQRLMTYGESGNFGKVDNQNGPKFAAIEGYQTGSPASYCFRRSSTSRSIICCRSDSSVTRSSRRR